MTNKSDFIIVGAGMIGLSLALGLGQAGFSVSVVESKTPSFSWGENELDARVSAIHLETKNFLSALNVWPALRNSATPLERMEVWDVLGGGRITFDSLEINQPALGYIVENRRVVRELWEACQVCPTIKFYLNHTPSILENQTLTLANGNTVSADYLIGADGAHSWFREQLPIQYSEKPYHQDAIVAVVESERAHYQVAHQAFLSTGPLGVLPLKHPHRVAIVWSANHARANELMALAEDDFNAELSNALNLTLGVLCCVSPRQRIPLVERSVDHSVIGNCVLVGDAAHTIHPLAGQGANLGFMDAEALIKAFINTQKKFHKIHETRILRHYERERRIENERMRVVMAGFKQLFAEKSPIVASLRSYGLNFVNDQRWLKKLFMREAIG